MVKKTIQKKVGKDKQKKERPFKNLFEKTPRNFKVGQNIQPKRDLTRFVRWPTYIVIQRKRRILYKRLKVPPQIHQFTNSLPSDKTKVLFKLFTKYAPETKVEKKARLLEAGKAIIDQTNTAKKDVSKKPKYLKCGLNHVTTLVEEKKAKLVVIAADVDPIELVLWLPQLCRSKDVPYCIVKSKARLGQFVGKKTATCLAFTDLRKEDIAEFEKLTASVRTLYNQNKEHLTKYSDIILGSRALARNEKTKKIKEAETINK